MAPIPQQTILYATYIKQTIAKAAQDVFAKHPDNHLKTTKVSLNLPLTRAQFPSVVIKYYERDIHNLGVDHHEWIEILDDVTKDPTGQFVRFEHYGYSGDVEFAVYGLSGPDRDLVGDSVVQMLTMPSVEAWTYPFWTRFYQANFTDPTAYEYDPSAEDHFINLNKDRIMGYGESEVVAPWMPDDDLVYQKSYRIPITGEFYSRTPVEGPLGKVREVDIYPYDPAVGDPVPNPNPQDPSPWLGEGLEYF